jgi:hypothetical protein
MKSSTNKTQLNTGWMDGSIGTYLVSALLPLLLFRSAARNPHLFSFTAGDDVRWKALP